MSSVISFSPDSSYAGDAVVIVGSNFVGATSVKFGGVDAASYTIIDDNNLIAIVAAGGATGDIEVQGTEGLGSNEGFTFLGVRPGVVKVKMPNSPPYPDGGTPTGDDLVWVTDMATNILRKAKISDLPFTDGGGGGSTTITSVPSPFIVSNQSANYSYDADANAVKITDERLLNKTQYPIAATQYGGGYFNINLLTFNAIDPDDETKGSVIISAFQLDDAQQLIVIVPGERDAEGDTQMAQLQADVKLLKQIAFPFIPTALGTRGGHVWYTGLMADLAGTGWVEDETMRGLYPIHQDPDDDVLSAGIGTQVGDNEITIDMENLPAEGLDIKVKKGTQYMGSSTNSAVQELGTGVVDATETVKTENMGEGTAIQHIPRSMTGIWIKFIGIA